MKTKCLAVTAAAFAAAGMIVGMLTHAMMLNFGTSGMTMAATHPMTFGLGCGGFLFALIFERMYKLSDSKLARPAYFIYIIGVALTVIMLFVRGYAQMSGAVLTSGEDAAISGIAGIGHTVLAVGMVLFFIILIKRSFASHEDKKDDAE